MTPAHPSQARRRPWWLLPALALLLLVGVNLLLWTWAEHRRTTNEEHIFRGRAELLVHNIRDQVENDADALRALRGFVQAEGTPSPAGWHAFLGSLNAKERYPGIREFQFDLRVDASAREVFDRQAASEGRPPIWDIEHGRGSAPRVSPAYFPIILAEPEDPGVLSFDVSSRVEAWDISMMPSAEKGQVTLGAPIHPVQSPTEWVLPMVAPVYAGTPHPISLDERRATLRGFVGLLMEPDPLFAGLPDTELLDYEVFDGPESTPTARIHARGPNAGASMLYTEHMDIFGRAWTVVVRPTPWWNKLGRRDSWQALASGIAVSLGLLAILAGLALARERALTLADRMTAELREVNRALLDLATTDSLTGLLNRRAMETRLDEEESRALRDRTPLSLIAMDVDFFKHVNDKYGHAMGDAVLRSLGLLLREQTRLTDHAGRMGGEEFLIVCPNTDADGALVVAEALRARFEAMDHAEGDIRIRVTASFGVVASEAGERADVERMTRRVDRALYKAKADGRNRVELWVPPVVTEES